MSTLVDALSPLVDALVFGRTVTRSVQRWEHGRAIDELCYRPAVTGDENGARDLGDKLYVSVDRLDYLEKYWSAESATPKLDRLGGTGWERVQKRVKKSMRDMAQELLKLYAALRPRTTRFSPVLPPSSVATPREKSEYHDHRLARAP